MRYKELRRSRDKLFPGKIRYVDFLNERYIGRKPMYDFIMSHSVDVGGGKMLDYGCGSMPYRKLFENVSQYVGLDVQGADAFGFKPEKDVVYYNGRDIPFEDSYFDSAILFQVLEHVDDVDRALSELHRVLKPGAKVLITVPMAFFLHMEPWDYRRFTKYGFEKLLLKYGFTNVEITGSTNVSDTIRGMIILELGVWSYKKCFIKRAICKTCIIYANLRYMLSDKDTTKTKFPLDWYVYCENGRK